MQILFSHNEYYVSTSVLFTNCKLHGGYLVVFDDSYVVDFCNRKQWKMDVDSFDIHSDCSSELSETRSELEARIYSIIHHNDFSGTSNAPCIDPKYGVEFNSNGEVSVFLKDPADVINTFTDELPKVCNLNVIPTIILDDDDDMENSKCTAGSVDTEFVETSLKKKKKKKKKKLNDESIEEYMNIVKNTNVLKEYKEKSGLNKMNSKSSDVNNVALNVAFHNERAMPMTPSEVLRQYRIGKPTESSLWYRCPQTWTPDMVKFYTKIRKSKRNFDCSEEIQKIRGTYLHFNFVPYKILFSSTILYF